MTSTDSPMRSAAVGAPGSAADDLTRTPTVADRLVAMMAELGISTVFGIHGANSEDVFAAVTRATGMSPVIAKHEFGAGAMADGVSRISGEPSAVVVTSGAATMNLVPALAEAYDSRVPVLAVIGTSPRALVGRGGFQDMLNPPDTIDLSAILAGVVGDHVIVDEPAALGPAMQRLRRTLASGLPAAIVIPKDVQGAPYASAPQLAPPRSSAAASADVDACAEIADLLANRLLAAHTAGTPICLWAGEEASRLGLGSEIATIADLLDADVVVSPGGRDVISPGSSAGVTGVMGHPSAHRAIRAAQLCLLVGCRASATDRGGLDDHLIDMDIIGVGCYPPRYPGPVDFRQCSDLGEVLRRVIGTLELTLTARPPRTAQIERLTTPPATGLSMRTAVEAIGAALPPATTVFADAGNAGAAAIHDLPPGDGRFVVALGMGGMGYGIAAGIGHAIHTQAIHTSLTGAPERTVVIAGDGSFYMHGMEIHTAVQYQAPVTMVILNNDAHGMCVTREQLYFPDIPGINRFTPTDIASGLDAAFIGMPVLRVQKAAGLAAACAELITHGSGPNCLVIDVDPEEIPPFIPFLPKGTP